MRRVDTVKGPPATVNDELLGPGRTDSGRARKIYAVSDAFDWPDGPKLNVGCGSDIREGDDWVNIDKYPVDDRVLLVDIEKGVLPFEDDHFAAIMSIEFFEHIPHRSAHVDGELFFVVVNELLRVSRNGARWLIITPASPYSLSVACHCRLVTEGTYHPWTTDWNMSSGERVTITNQVGRLKMLDVKNIRHWTINKFFGQTWTKCISFEVEK